MGILRYLLAVAVIMAHSQYNMTWLPAGNIAVESFFILSGFYMALVLNENYHRFTPFYINRALRLLPLYWCILGLTLLLHPKMISHIAHLPLPATILVATTNLTVLGQDILFYLTPDLTFTAAPLGTGPARLFPHLVIPPSWTLSLEITFYLLAPFIVKSLPRIVALAIASLGLRLYLISKGYTEDPFNYRLFPQELLFFCLGAFAWHLLQTLRGYNQPVLTTYSRPVSLILFAWLACFTLIPIATIPNMVIWYTALTLGLPFLFQATSSHRLGNAVGELSYPLYLCHLIAIGLATKTLGQLPSLHPAFITLASVIIATAIAFILHHCLEAPLTHLRRKFRSAAA